MAKTSQKAEPEPAHQATDSDSASDSPESGPPAEAAAPPSAPAASASPAPARPSSGSSALSPPGRIRGCPMPAGAVIFGDLTSAFVDGARLLRFLGEHKHTGAVIDAGSGRQQIAVLHDGNVLGLVLSTDRGTERLASLRLPAPGAADEHEITVVTYRPEVALALGQLVNLGERFAKMHGSFVDMPSLLAYLKREKASGAVRVTTDRDVAVVLLRNGDVLGAYTKQKPELDDADVSYPLARESDAEIDVHIGSLTIPPPSVPAASVSG